MGPNFDLNECDGLHAQISVHQLFRRFELSERRAQTTTFKIQRTFLSVNTVGPNLSVTDTRSSVKYIGFECPFSIIKKKKKPIFF